MSILRLLNRVQLQLRSASESIQPVFITPWVGLNSNKGRLMKSSASETGLSFSVCSKSTYDRLFWLGFFDLSENYLKISDLPVI